MRRIKAGREIEEAGREIEEDTVVGWLWHSLLQGRNVLLEGIRWQVGNGSNISFWTHKWVPYHEDFYIRTPRGPFDNSSLVSDFITGGSWNMSKLRAHVSDKEANFIAEIPISRTQTNDKIIWHYDAKGNYTVKSGYRQALKLRNSLVKEVASSSSLPNRDFWKKVWNIKVMPKIKTFWWRVCSNALATRENLYKRKCSPSPLCQVCNSQVETIEHVFFECPWTRSVWFGSNHGLRVQNLSGNFISRVSSIIDILPSKSQALKLLAFIAITSWNIWKSRNKFIFEHSSVCPSQVIWASNVMQGEVDFVFPCSPTLPSSLVHSHSSQESSPKWVPPTLNVVKLNCDGAFKSNQGAIGIVARDSEGSILLCIGERWHASSALAMELLAMRSACNLALTHGWVGAIIESDSSDAIAYCSSESEPPWVFGVIVADIRELASRLDLKFSWVRRTCNRVAHHIATVAHNSVGNFSWNVNFPPELTSLMRSDLE